MISRNLTQEVSFETFATCLADAQANSEQVRGSTTPSDNIPANAKYYMSGDGFSGFAVSKTGELTSLFSLVKGRGDRLVSEAVFYGAEFLDCFDGYLPTLYAKHGFVETLRQPNWTPGQPDVVFMHLHSALPAVDA